MKKVLLTGISGNLGRAVAKVLHREAHVIGVDRRPFIGRPKDVEHFQIDVRKRKLDEVFRKHKVGFEGPVEHPAPSPVARSLYFKDPSSNFLELSVPR